MQELINKGSRALAQGKLKKTAMQTIFFSWSGIKVCSQANHCTSCSEQAPAREAYERTFDLSSAKAGGSKVQEH